MFLRRKLPRSSVVLLSIAVVCAVAAALVMRAYALRIDAVRPDGGPPVEVVAAAAPVARGALLTQEVVEVVTVPSRFTPPGAIRAIERVIGRVAVSDIAAGEVVTEHRLAGRGSGPTSSLVPAGMRAVEVPVGAAVGVEPGDLVDVLATFGGGSAHTELTGEALEVLAIDRAAGVVSSETVGVMLLVTPTVAERLAFAAAFGTLSLAVRGPDDVVTTLAPTFPVPTTAGG